MELGQYLFRPQGLPRELFDVVDMKTLTGFIEVNALDIIKTWERERIPQLNRQQECTDMISGETLDQLPGQVSKEVETCVKWSAISYALPYYMSTISTNLHLRNPNFLTFMNNAVADSTILAYQHMDRLLCDQAPSVTLPDKAQVAGYYIHTPLQIWNRKNRPIVHIPVWEKRQQLLRYRITGGVNVYVLRQQLAKGYQCIILFRGTANEFNALEVYGEEMKNTQAYRTPNFDPETNRVEPNGSETIPLMNQMYTEMVRNVLPHIIQCLEWLRWDHPACQRIVATGHSIGAAMVVHLCYLLRAVSMPMWEKTYFRGFAAPLTCNDAMTLKIEQWLIDSRQTNKYIEVVNSDDFVNIQHSLGGAEGIKASVKQGTDHIGAFLIDSFLTKTGVRGGVLDFAKRNHETTLAAFLNGALQAQIKAVPQDKKAPFRLGQRYAELQDWKTPGLTNTYNGTVRLIYCNRSIDWATEFVGKSHTRYLDINMSVFWGSLRLYEDERYRSFAKHTLRANNNLQIVPMFPERDIKQAMDQLAAYSPFANSKRVVRVDK